MAPQYPGLAVGAFLVSMRDISTVLVFDPTTKKIKWAIEGRTLRQHDPDFIGGGWISVFDNNSDETPGGENFGGSRMVAFRTETGERRGIYPPAAPGSGPSTRTTPDTSGRSTRSSARRPSFSRTAIGSSPRPRRPACSKSTRTASPCGNGRHEPHGPKGFVSEVLEGTRYDLDGETVRKWPRP